MLLNLRYWPPKSKFLFFGTPCSLIISLNSSLYHLVVGRQDPVELLVAGAPLRVSDVVADAGDASVPLLRVTAGHIQGMETIIS